MDTGDQMDMMMTMMQLPEFSGSYTYDDVPPPEFCGATNTVTVSHLTDKPQVAFTNLPSTTISFLNPTPVLEELAPRAGEWGRASEKAESMAAMREMIFRIAAMQPIHIDPESVKAPKRRNVKISKDPQSVAARHRRERISERIRILQRLVPGGTKMDTASMLDEAIRYVKFLKTQVQSLERAAANRPPGLGYLPLQKPYHYGYGGDA